MVDVTVQGLTVPNSPLVAKAYDAAMIRVTDIQDGHVGVLSTFRVDVQEQRCGQCPLIWFNRIESEIQRSHYINIVQLKRV